MPPDDLRDELLRGHVVVLYAGHCVSGPLERMIEYLTHLNILRNEQPPTETLQ